MRVLWFEDINLYVMAQYDTIINHHYFPTAETAFAEGKDIRVFRYNPLGKEPLLLTESRLIEL